MKILAIETSCDETAIAILAFSGSWPNPVIHVLSNHVFSQATLHAEFGGVVPNLAKREHQKNLVPLLLHVLRESGLYQSKPQKRKFSITKKIEKILEREPELFAYFKKQLFPVSDPDIDAIAVTYGPGLAPALWVGVNFAKALACLWDKPLIPINHMEGHIFSALLQKSRKKNFQFSISNFQFPALALLVSGGHTELVLMRGYGKYKIIGETVDDAAGEAFDKVARMLELPYPGGPQVARLAKSGKPNAFAFPRPMLRAPNFNFSFSGLKTAVLYLIRDMPTKTLQKNRAHIAASFETAVVDVLVVKTISAAKAHHARTILLGGGVAANQKLRSVLTKASKNMRHVKMLLPITRFTGDNALMIALAAFFPHKKTAGHSVRAEANARLS